MTKVVCKVSKNLDRFYLPDVTGQYARANEIIELSIQEALKQEAEGTIEILEQDKVEFYNLEATQKDETLEKKNQEIRYLKAKIAKQEAANTAEAENAMLKNQIAELQKQLKGSDKKEEPKVKIVSEDDSKAESKPKPKRKSKSIIKKESK